jgi:hypothetical protein
MSHALCSACALVSAAVLGRLAGFGFGVDILITRDIRLAPARCAGELTNFRSGWRAGRIPSFMQRSDDRVISSGRQHGPGRYAG